MFETKDRASASDVLARRTLWGTELVSGKYAQGRGRLHQNLVGEDQYCCLGVACSTFKSTVNLSSRLEGNSWYYSENPYDTDYWVSTGSNAYMPKKLRKFLGLSENSEKLLATLNDSGVSFEVIASTLHFLPIDLND